MYLPIDVQWSIYGKNVQACVAGELHMPVHYVAHNPHEPKLSTISSSRLSKKIEWGTENQKEVSLLRIQWGSRMCWPSWNDIFFIWKEIGALSNLQMNASADEWMHQTQWEHCIQDYTILLFASTSKEFVSPPSALVLFHYQT